jgi:hypothetical protein
MFLRDNFRRSTKVRLTENLRGQFFAPEQGARAANALPFPSGDRREAARVSRQKINSGGAYYEE